MAAARWSLLSLAAVVSLALAGACGGESPAPATATITPAETTGTPPPTSQPATGTPTATPAPTLVSTATAVATPTATAAPSPAVEPLGFPVDPATSLGVVVGTAPNRSIDWSGGPNAFDYSLRDQPSNAPGLANRSGWDCRVHVEYEGYPAVDWYIPVGTPLVATMDGVATLHVITVSNAFDVYGASREPYLGDPDRSRAALSPFPGPGGGKGVFITLNNAGFALEYAHLDLAATLAVVPAASFIAPFTAATGYAALFAAMRDYRDSTPIATWGVRRGDVIGYSGDAGYSEAPHLHYTIRRQGGSMLCPTTEAGFSDGGWLFR